MRDFIVVAIVIGAVPFILARPYIGILVWSWIGYMNPHKLAWGWARSMPLAEIAAVPTMLGLLFSREKKRVPISAVTIVWAAFLIFLTVSTFVAIYSEAAWSQWTKVAKIQLVAILTLVLITDRQRLHRLIWVIVLSIGFFGVKGGLYVLRTGGSTGRVWGPPGGFISGNNELALALLMVLPLMFFLRRHESRGWVRHAMLLVIGLTVVSVIGSFSRGALLGLIACGVFLWLKSSRKLPVAIAIAVGSVVVFALMPQTWWARMGTIETYQEDSSARGRLDAWTLAFRVANDRPFGGGFDFWSPDVYNAYGVGFIKAQDAHSIYFEILGEHGWVGLLLFLGLIATTWRAGTKLVKATRSSPDLEWERDLAKMLQVSLIAYMVGGAFLGLAYFDLPYHLIGMMVIMSDYLARRGDLPVASGER